MNKRELARQSITQLGKVASDLIDKYERDAGRPWNDEATDYLCSHHDAGPLTDAIIHVEIAINAMLAYAYPKRHPDYVSI